jgi:hypothetical protein
LHKRLSWILNLEHETLVEELSRLERNELKELLFKAAPKYLLSCPSAPPEKVWGYLIDDYMGDEIPPECPIVHIPMEWNIEEDFEDWTPKKKRNWSGNVCPKRQTNMMEQKSACSGQR